MTLSASALARGLVFALFLALAPSCSTWECNADSCSDGCCDAEGVCQVGNPDDTCGLGGAACRDCTTQRNATCAAGQCVARCTPRSCPNGCCDEFGLCRDFSDQSSVSCGRGGAVCADCNSRGSITKDCEEGVCCTSFLNPCATSAECCPGSSCRADSFDSALKCR